MDFFQHLIASGVSSIVLLAIASFFGKKWIENRIAQSIKHEYDKKLETYKLEAKRKEQAAVVAEAITEWAASPTEVSDIKRLQKLVWEATLWLPDELAIDFNNMFMRKGKTPKEILVAIKSHLWGKETTLRPEDIINFELQKKITT